MYGFRLSLYISEHIVNLSHFLLPNHYMSNTKPTTNVHLRVLKNVVYFRGDSKSKFSYLFFDLLNLIKITCWVYHLKSNWQCTKLYRHSVWGRIGVHMLNNQMEEEPTNSCGIKTPTGHRELLSYWSIYLSTLHIIRYQGWMKGYLRIV